MKTIDIVLPVYNEEESVRDFNQALFSVLESVADRYRFHVIYVLDPCRDNSLAVLRELAAQHSNITVLHLSRRFGHQMSLVAGIDHSAGDAVIMMDCDLQHPPALIPALLEKFAEGYDIVHTVRTYNAAAGFMKRWSSQLFYKLLNSLSPVEIQESAADFRLISRKVANLFRSSIREQNQFLRGLFQWVGFRNTIVSFVSPPRAKGSTKYGFLRLIAFSIAGITSFSKLPLRLATLLGFAISFLCVTYGFVVIAQFFFSGRFPPGYTSLFVSAMFVGGLQLVVLGIVGEYLGSVFEEVKRRPLYIVDEVVHGGAGQSDCVRHTADCSLDIKRPPVPSEHTN
jgi:dolichol-phosphate mannosyltransferase